MKKVLKIKKVSSPLGEIVIASQNGFLVALSFFNRFSVEGFEKRFKAKAEYGGCGTLEKTVRQLNEYFDGKRKVFDIPLKFAVGTDFQKRCWEALLKIPFGKTVSYSEQARMIGRPSAVRAVANANRLNPIAIIVPCHRVIGKDGSLTGYAGGLDKKAFLLTLENALKGGNNGTRRE